MVAGHEILECCLVEVPELLDLAESLKGFEDALLEWSDDTVEIG